MQNIFKSKKCLDLSNRFVQRTKSIFSGCKESYSEYELRNMSVDLYEVDSVMKYNKSEILYGIYPVLLALEKHKRCFNSLYYKEEALDKNKRIREIFELCQSYKIPCFPADKRKLTKLAGKDAIHQGVCLESSKLVPKKVDDDLLNDISNSQEEGYHFWLYLDQINDPMNMGAILRSAYYFGVGKVFISSFNR